MVNRALLHAGKVELELTEEEEREEHRRRRRSWPSWPRRRKLS